MPKNENQDIFAWNDAIQQMNDEKQLSEILSTMDVPPTRMKDWRWLLRNLWIRNSENPRLQEALELIKAALRREANEL